MFADTDLTAYNFMTDFNGPDRQFPNPFYPTGLYEGENPIYKYGPDSTDYPTLILPCKLSDGNGNEISPGYYTAVVPTDRESILLYKGGNVVAKIKIVKLVEKMYDNDELNAENELVAKVEEAKRNKKLKKQREAEEALSAYRDRMKADIFADIHDSGKGYYVINYNYKGIKAKGIVQK